MNGKIREHVAHLFAQVPQTAQSLELQEELVANLNDRYNDLLEQGEPEDAAFSTVINDIGDVRELFSGLLEPEPEPAAARERPAENPRIQSAQRFALAAGLLVAGIAFPIFLSSFSAAPLGFLLMVLCWAAAVALLVYDYMSRPRYRKKKDTVVEDFKAWQSSHDRRRELSRSLQAAVYTLTVPTYLMMGLFFGWWHPGWIIFPLAPAVCQLIRVVLLASEDR